MPVLQYGNTIRTPTDADSELQVDSRVAQSNAPDETIIANLTQISFKTQQVINMVNYGNKSTNLHLVEGKRNANQVVTDEIKFAKN